MLKLLTSAIVMLFLSGSAVSGQQAEKPPEKKSSVGSDQPYKWDASLNLYSLITSGHLWFMVRYSPDKKGAFRVAFSDVETGKMKSSQYVAYPGGPSLDTILPVKSKFNYGYYRLGYERHLNTGKHQLYYGGDLGFSLNSTRLSHTDTPVSRQYDISLMPFIGLKYRLLPRLSVSAELGGNVKYRNDRLIGYGGVTVSRYDMWGLSLDGNRLLRISYHF